MEAVVIAILCGPSAIALGLSWPKISIVMPSFNKWAYLEKTRCLVLLQGYPNLEYLIIDGGSSGQSVDVFKKYESLIDFWVSETDNGQSHSINKGLDGTFGELMGRLNPYDYYFARGFVQDGQGLSLGPLVGSICVYGHSISR